MKVYQIMTRNPICVETTDFADEALSVMKSNRIRHLIVLNFGRPIGVLSINDFPQFIKPQLAVIDIMTTQNVIVINQNDDVEVAKNKISLNRIGCLPVVDDYGDLTGIITTKDIF